ncbi:hypothetical protein AB9_021 [Acinetobacter phage vB_AbaM_B9]|nr:hypothetical protein AB9_021 [Acinetobacter phage vB_AbaM_B9]
MRDYDLELEQIRVNHLVKKARIKQNTENLVAECEGLFIFNAKVAIIQEKPESLGWLIRITLEEHLNHEFNHFDYWYNSREALDGCMTCTCSFFSFDLFEMEIDSFYLRELFYKLLSKYNLTTEWNFEHVVEVLEVENK